MLLEVCAAHSAFLGKLHKKVEECPQLSGGRSSQIRSQTSPKCPEVGPNARGASAGMIPWLSWLKLSREMGL